MAKNITDSDNLRSLADWLDRLQAEGCWPGVTSTEVQDDLRRIAAKLDVHERGQQVRFIDNNDGTITDTKTNLVWEKSGTNTKMTWEEAQEYANAKASVDSIFWRLPTIEELISLIDYHHRRDPAIDSVFQCRPDGYWSSSTYANCPDGAWYVYFYGGIVYAYNKSCHYYVRCVRNL